MPANRGSGRERFPFVCDVFSSAWTPVPDSGGGRLGGGPLGRQRRVERSGTGVRSRYRRLRLRRGAPLGHPARRVEPWARQPRGGGLEGPRLLLPAEGPAILVFDADGHFLTGWGGQRLRDAHGIFIGPDDHVYLCNRDEHEVLKLTPEGRTVLALGQRGRPSLQAPFNHPADVAVSPAGEIYVADGYGNSSVHRFSADGRHLGSWGTPGSGRAGTGNRDRSVRAPGRPGDAARTLPFGAPSVLDRRQWLRPSWPARRHAAAGPGAPGHARPHAHPRELAQPDRNLLLDSCSARSSHPTTSAVSPPSRIRGCSALRDALTRPPRPRSSGPSRRETSTASSPSSRSGPGAWPVNA